MLNTCRVQIRQAHFYLTCWDYIYKSGFVDDLVSRVASLASLLFLEAQIVHMLHDVLGVVPIVVPVLAGSLVHDSILTALRNAKLLRGRVPLLKRRLGHSFMLHG